MKEYKETPAQAGPTDASAEDDGDLQDMLQEVRILLPGAQVLTAFLVTLPFSPVFSKVVQSEKWVFIATFLCSLASLVLFSAPAVQHRLMRPLRDRVRFKHFATQEIVAGSAALSLALVLSTDLVISEVFGERAALVVAACVAVVVGVLWWLLPKVLKSRM